MNVRYYQSAGGKNLIIDYVDKLPKRERMLGLAIIQDLANNGHSVLASLDTRQIDGKLWEIKFYNHNRFFYCCVEGDTIYLVHACKKQKNAAEQKDINKAKQRMKIALSEHNPNAAK
jgi:phage-related protein